MVKLSEYYAVKSYDLNTTYVKCSNLLMSDESRVIYHTSFNIENKEKKKFDEYYSKLPLY